MSDETKNVYVVKIAFEHEGLAYAAGEKYELPVAFVATLPEGSVEEFVPTPEQETPIEEGGEAGADSGIKPEASATAEPAKPWVGNHSMRDN